MDHERVSESGHSLGSTALLCLVLPYLATCSSHSVPLLPLTPVSSPAELMFAAVALADSSAGPLFSRGRLDTAVALLSWIHLHYPQTRNIGAGSDLSLQLRLADSLSSQLVDTAQKPISVDRWLDPPRTGFLQFDRITESLGGASAMHLQGFFPQFLVTVYYREPVNIPAVARLYAPLRPAIDISPLQGLIIGHADRTHIGVGDSAWIVHMTTGWGDCMAGCIYRHFWTFRYLPPSGRVEIMTDSGPPVPSQRNGA